MYDSIQYTKVQNYERGVGQKALALFGNCIYYIYVCKIYLKNLKYKQLLFVNIVIRSYL